MDSEKLQRTANRIVRELRDLGATGSTGPTPELQEAIRIVQDAIPRPLVAQVLLPLSKLSSDESLRVLALVKLLAGFPLGDANEKVSNELEAAQRGVEQPGHSGSGVAGVDRPQ